MDGLPKHGCSKGLSLVDRLWMGVYITGESATHCYLFYSWILKYESERAASGAGSLVIKNSFTILCGYFDSEMFAS